jgi:hypothetical protein
LLRTGLEGPGGSEAIRIRLKAGFQRQFTACRRFSLAVPVARETRVENAARRGALARMPLLSLRDSSV